MRLENSHRLSRENRFFEEYKSIDKPENPLIYHYSIGSILTGYFSSAAAGTIGNGGLLIEDKNYLVAAQMVDTFLEDENLHCSLIKAGRQRLKYFRSA